jgi:MYXO-CTERM domain-containing protein
MRWSALLLCGGFLLAAGVVPVMADTVPDNDPFIFIDAGDPPPPIPISTGINEVQSNGTLLQTFDFINDTNAVITGFEFQTTVVPGFPTSLLNCASGYFLHCTVDYNSKTGSILFDFYGVNPPDGDEVASIDTEAGEKEGIPLDGVFHITLGGWNFLYNADHPIMPFVDSFTVATPEPSSLGFMAAGLLLLAGALRYRRRKTALQAARVVSTN